MVENPAAGWMIGVNTNAKDSHVILKYACYFFFLIFVCWYAGIIFYNAYMGSNPN